MAVKNPQTPESGGWLGADDFSRIKGIGNSIESHLHNAGILTFVQLAALSPAEIMTLISDVPGLSAKQIIKQNWTGQARALASDPTPVILANNTNDQVSRQHYTTFVVELLLDATNNVRRTRAVHTQSAAEGIWPGWDAEHLVTFLVNKAELRLPIAKPQRTLSGLLKVRELTLLPFGPHKQQVLLARNQPFDVHLVLDLSEVKAPDSPSLDCRATVYAKVLGGGPRLIAGEARSTLVPAQESVIDVKGVVFPEGASRLQTEVTLALHEAEPSSPGLTASLLEGNLILTY
jgi:hypothetical protein